MQTIEEAKKQANRLSARLSTLGVEVKRTQALEGVAAIHGFPSWNHMSAQLSRAANAARPATAIFPHHGMALENRHSIFEGPSGVGKTFTLGRLAAWLAQRDQRIVTINLCHSDVGPWWDAKAFQAEPVEIECTSEQDWEQKIRGAAEGYGNGLYLNLRHSPNDDFGGLLIGFVRRLRKIWPYDWILIDELDGLVHREPEVLDHLFSSCDADARMVVVSQAAPQTHLGFETDIFSCWLYHSRRGLRKCSSEQNEQSQHRLLSKDPYHGLLFDMIVTNNFILQQMRGV